jgi:hypothetical protein
MERLEQLIALYLDGALSPGEERELAERIRANRDTVQTLHTFYQQDRLLTEMHQPETLEPVKAIMDEIAQAEGAFVGRVIDTVRTESSREIGRHLSHAEWLSRWLTGPLAVRAAVHWRWIFSFVPAATNAGLPHRLGQRFVRAGQTRPRPRPEA